CLASQADAGMHRSTDHPGGLFLHFRGSPGDGRRRSCYGPTMKDQRVKVFRATLDALTESLEALVRVARWTDAEAPPEPLRAAVARLPELLCWAAGRAPESSVGSPADTSKVSAMCATMKRLDAAYVAYRKQLDAKPNHAADAAEALETDIAEATGAMGL